MIAPSISFDTNAVPELHVHMSLEDLKELIRWSGDQLKHAQTLLAEDEAKCAADPQRGRDYRLRTLVRGWEYAQDAHMSWFMEKVNVELPAAAVGPEGPGLGAVEPSNG